MPDDFPVLDDESVRDSVDTVLFHVLVGQLSVVVDDDGIIHLFAHLLDEWLDCVQILIGHANDVDTAILELGLSFGEVRDAGAAGWTPRGPKLHDVDAFGYVHRIALDPVSYSQFASRSAG